MISEKVSESFRGKRAIVTGGTGLIGRAVVELLLKYGCEVQSISMDDLIPERGNPLVTYTKADLRYFEVAKSLIHSVDYVFHLAGIKGSPVVTKTKPASFFVPMLQFNTNVLEAARLGGIKHLVYTSSVGAYSPAELLQEGIGDGDEPMDSFPGWAKRMAEKQIQAYKIQYGLEGFNVVRLGNVYGPGDNFDANNAMVIPSVIAKVADAVDKGESFYQMLGDGSPIRDFAYSMDIAQGILLTAYHSPDEPYLNLAGPGEVSILDVTNAIKAHTGICPVWQNGFAGGYNRRVLDISRARKSIGYDPRICLTEGVSQTYDWYKIHRDEYTRRQNYFTEK